MTTVSVKRLVGIVRNLPDVTTFVHAVFCDSDEYLLLQRIDDGKIVGWEQCVVDDAFEPVSSRITAEIGDEPICSFERDRNKFWIGSAARLAHELSVDSGLTTKLLQHSPFTVDVVREFVNAFCDGQSSFHSGKFEIVDRMSVPEARPSQLLLVSRILATLSDEFENILGYVLPVRSLARASGGGASADISIGGDDRLRITWLNGQFCASPLRNSLSPVWLVVYGIGEESHGTLHRLCEVRIDEHTERFPITETDNLFFVVTSQPTGTDT